MSMPCSIGKARRRTRASSAGAGACRRTTRSGSPSWAAIGWCICAYSRYSSSHSVRRANNASLSNMKSLTIARANMPGCATRPTAARAGTGRRAASGRRSRRRRRRSAGGTGSPPAPRAAARRRRAPRARARASSCRRRPGLRWRCGESGRAATSRPSSLRAEDEADRADDAQAGPQEVELERLLRHEHRDGAKTSRHGVRTGTRIESIIGPV